MITQNYEYVHIQGYERHYSVCYVCVCALSSTCSLSYRHRSIRNSSLRVEHWLCVCSQEEQASVRSVLAALAAAGDAQDLRSQSSLHQHEPQLHSAQSGHAHTLLTHTKHFIIDVRWCSLSLWSFTRAHVDPNPCERLWRTSELLFLHQTRCWFITSSSETISEAHGGLITVSVFIIGGEMNNNHTKPSAYAVMILRWFGA